MSLHHDRGYFFGVSSRTHINSCAEIMHRLCDRAMMIANQRKTYCPDFGVSRGLSSAKEQFELFKRGRKLINNQWVVVNENDVITNCDGVHVKSTHQSGLAIDFFAIHPDTGKADYRPEMLALIATCFFEAASDMSINIDWGGSFKSISDGCHVEINQ